MTIWCDDECGKEIVHWKNNHEDLDPIEITRYGEQQIGDERGRIRVFCSKLLVECSYKSINGFS